MKAKPSLLHFPNEILLNIWNAVQPDDIDNFALTCRHLRLLARDLVEEHKRLERNHRHISLYDRPLSDILRCFGEPGSRISLYPKVFYMTPVHLWSGEGGKETQAALERVYSMITEKRDSFPSQELAYLIERLNPDELHGAIAAIAAQCLPNLETIYYHECGQLRFSPEHNWNSMHFISGLVDGLMALTTLPVQCRVFPRFSHFHTDQHREGLGTDLSTFLPLLTLPNLRSFEARGHSCYYLNSLPFLRRTSKVEKLIIRPTEYSLRSIVVLLGAFEALRTLVLYFADWQNLSVNDLIPAVYSSLLEYFRDSLEHLQLYDQRRKWELLGSVQPFSVLSFVAIQPDMLITDRDTMPRLIDVFPRSIERIIFSQTFSDTHEEEMFAGFLSEREAKVPNLRLIVGCQLMNFRNQSQTVVRDHNWFTYIRYHDDLATIRVIDPDPAGGAGVRGALRHAPASQWKIWQCPSDNLFSPKEKWRWYCDYE